MNERKGKKEVLYVWPYLNWGGAQIYFMGLMKLARARYAVSALMPRGSADRVLGYMQHLGVPCEFFDSHFDNAPIHNLRDKLRRRLKKAQTDFAIARHLGWSRRRRATLHVDIGPWQSFWLLLYLSWRGQVLVTLHTALPQISLSRGFAWKLKFNILGRMKGFHLLASNRDVRESLKPFLSEKIVSKIRLAYSGVDVCEIKEALAPEFNRAELCRRYGLPTDRFYVFAVGQFIERKGCWVLLEAAQKLMREHPEMMFVWIGTGKLDEETARRVEEYGLSDSFRLLSSDEIGQSRLDLLTLLRLADLFVLPSSNEGLPVALLEAMALGKACIASRINAIPEAVTDGETGILIPPGDSASLANAIAKMLADDVARVSLARAGQAHVLANFDERRTAQITVGLYDECALERV
ncbi:MAG: glycosyltransferase family 4 protein [Pyrinomonadaceae bacterium]|nr:glycosyltransferase family 4 protein [Pyrinomonadaceae bacterium]